MSIFSLSLFNITSVAAKYNYIYSSAALKYFTLLFHCILEVIIVLYLLHYIHFSY